MSTLIKADGVQVKRLFSVRWSCSWFQAKELQIWTLFPNSVQSVTQQNTNPPESSLGELRQHLAVCPLLNCFQMAASVNSCSRGLVSCLRYIPWCSKASRNTNQWMNHLLWYSENKVMLVFCWNGRSTKSRALMGRGAQGLMEPCVRFLFLLCGFLKAQMSCLIPLHWLHDR